MDILTTNFQYHDANHESTKYVLDSSKEEKQLSPDVINALLEASPEMEQIDALVDSKCYSLHKDEKLSYFSELFKQIIFINENLFSCKASSEKAKILFAFHSDAVTHQIVHSEKFSSLVESFFQRLEDPYKTSEIKKVIIAETERKLKERISYMHSDYIRYATAIALEMSINDIPLPSSEDAIEAQELKKPSKMDVYEK